MRKQFVKTLTTLAENDPDVMLITGDLGFTVFDEFKEQFPDQYLNAGLTEQCMVGMAAGLALEGKKVFLYSIIPFLIYRAFEQIRNDLCYQKVPVKLVGVGSGTVYGAEGATHHAIDDLGVMTTLPGLTVLAPGDPVEVHHVVSASIDFEGPCYIRLNRGGDTVLHSAEKELDWTLGQPLLVRGNPEAKVTLMACGNVLALAVDVFEELQKRGEDANVYSLHTLKPMDLHALKQCWNSSKLVVGIEEHVARNGVCSYIKSHLADDSRQSKFLGFSLTDAFSHKVGGQGFLREQAGLDKGTIIDSILKSI